ncbi:RNA ligase [Candidatus Micrarchaeota archaeon]|nr:RNA ligase [Candidatus Micrarchaeota archaeon]
MDGIVEKGIEKRKIIEHDGYLQFREKYRGVERGTIVFKNGRVVPGYPHIKRIFNIENGIKKHFEGIFTAEEKIDGYNLRSILHKGKLMCLSRGGFVDWFGMEKLGEVEIFLKKNPKFVVYGEMKGNTPYTPPAERYDVRYYVFDLWNGKRFLKRKEIGKKLEGYKIKQVPLVGEFKRDETEKLKKVLKRMEKNEKEGIVFKAEKRVKFVLPSADIEDLEQKGHLLFDLPPGYYKQRIFRSFLSIKQLGLEKRRYNSRMGRAIYGGLEKAVKEGNMSERYRIRMSLKGWEKLKKEFGKEIKIEEVDLKKWKGTYEIEFLKVYKRSSSILKNAVTGFSVAD